MDCRRLVSGAPGCPLSSGPQSLCHQPPINDTTRVSSAVCACLIANLVTRADSVSRQGDGAPCCLVPYAQVNDSGHDPGGSQKSSKAGML